MIDTKELRQSLGAVQPEEVAELLDRLEEAEKERDWNAERLEDAIEECTALRAKIEAMEKQEPVNSERNMDLLKTTEGLYER